METALGDTTNKLYAGLPIDSGPRAVRDRPVEGVLTKVLPSGRAGDQERADRHQEDSGD